MGKVRLINLYERRVATSAEGTANELEMEIRIPPQWDLTVISCGNNTRASRIEAIVKKITESEAGQPALFHKIWQREAAHNITWEGRRTFAMGWELFIKMYNITAADICVCAVLLEKEE